MTVSFLEKFRTRPKNAPPPPPPTDARKRVPRATEPFIILLLSRRQVVRQLKSAACWDLYTILVQESFRHRGEIFVLPTDELAADEVLVRTNLRRALHQLETSGLIAVYRQPPKPPLIKVL